MERAGAHAVVARPALVVALDIDAVVVAGYQASGEAQVPPLTRAVAAGRPQRRGQLAVTAAGLELLGSKLHGATIRADRNGGRRRALRA
jgi:hypothetical protein